MDKHSTVTVDPGTRQQGDRLWEYEDVARYLGVSLATVRDLKRSRGLPYKRVGRAIRFRRSEVDQWIEAQQEPQQDRAA